MKGHTALMQSARVEGSAARDDWRTPERVLVCVRAAFGGDIELDPCASEDSSQWIAQQNYSGPTYWEERRKVKHKDGTEEALIIPHYGNGCDGLSESWTRGTVFVNYPYSQAAEWGAKALHEWTAYAVVPRGRAFIILCPARTDTLAWKLLTSCASAVCLVRGRLKFIGGDNVAPFPSALIYLGETPGRFAQAMLPLGPSWKPLCVGGAQ